VQILYILFYHDDKTSLPDVGVLQNIVFTYSIGNSMVSSAIWEKICTNEFFKHDQKSLKNSRVFVFFQIEQETILYLIG
jgi:hypothetical protein